MNIKAGNRIHVDFIGESATNLSGIRIEGVGNVDRAEDGYVFGHLDNGQTFMCPETDVVVINDDAETEFKIGDFVKTCFLEKAKVVEVLPNKSLGLLYKGVVLYYTIEALRVAGIEKARGEHE